MDKFTQDYCKSVRRRISNRIIAMRHNDLIHQHRRCDKKITYHQLKGYLDGLLSFYVIDDRIYNHYFYYISHCQWLDWS
jgi:hypothetical protein